MSAPTVSTRYDLEPGSLARTRDFARAVLRGWGRDDLAEDVELVVSEFVTGSIVAGSGGTIVLHRNERGVHVEMTADDAEFDAENRESLGLRVVAATSKAWGVSYSWPRLRTVWSDVEAADR